MSDGTEQNRIHPLKIGTLSLPVNVLLAPLAGVTDLSFRLLCKEQGAGLVYTEMISAKGVHYKGQASLALADTVPEEAPLAVQIFGSEPELMAEAAAVFEARGAALIDINMGCPMRKVTSNHEGSALLHDPELIYRIVRAVSQAVRIPVTVKMRRGFEIGAETVPECAKAAEAGGAKAVTVHGRFRDEYYTGHADLGCIRRVKEAVSIPVIGNGDVTSREEALRMLAETGCDGVMIGRGALGNPWIFGQILSPGRQAPTLSERRETVLRHLALAVSRKGETLAVPEMRKHVAWYLKGLPGAARIRDAVCRCTGQAEMASVLEDYFNGLPESSKAGGAKQ